MCDVADPVDACQVAYIDLIQTHDIEFTDLNQVRTPPLPMQRAAHPTSWFNARMGAVAGH
jgi:hypothetical protein